MRAILPAHDRALVAGAWRLAPRALALTRKSHKLSCGVAEGWIYGDAPLRKEPFWDVDPVFVLLAPSPQFCRRGIHLGRELQLLNPQLEFGGERRAGRSRTSPIGVSAVASHSWETASINTGADDTPSFLYPQQKSLYG